jgi:hypothetical protein
VYAVQVTPLEQLVGTLRRYDNRVGPVLGQLPAGLHALEIENWSMVSELIADYFAT